MFVVSLNPGKPRPDITWFISKEDTAERVAEQVADAFPGRKIEAVYRMVREQISTQEKTDE